MNKNIKIRDVKSFIREANKNSNGCPQSAEFELDAMRDSLPEELYAAVDLAIEHFYRIQCRIDMLLEEQIGREDDGEYFDPDSPTAIERYLERTFCAPRVEFDFPKTNTFEKRDDEDLPF